MFGKKQWLLDDAEFIISEFKRFKSIIQTNFKDVSKEDMWFSLPAISTGEMIIGKDAESRLRKLAEEAGRRANLTHRVEPENLIRPMRKLFSKRFIYENLPVEMKHVERLLNSVGRAAQEKCETITHIVPCHLMTATEPAKLSIGPVHFRNRKFTRQFLLEKSKKSSLRNDPNRREYLRSLLTDGLRYYRNFGWSAEVKIENCDKKTSKIIATRAVTCALDCIHLLFSAQSTNSMRIGGPAMRRDNRAWITLSAEDDLSASLSMSGFGQVGFGSDWAECLERKDFKAALKLCGVALEAAVDPDCKRPLSRRFLDAAQWFGEASRDDSSSTQVIKYVTALERMVMTEEKDDITTLLAERISAMCLENPTIENRNIWRDKARSIYGLRSKLVHGSMSPTAIEARRGVYSAATLSREVLLLTLEHFGETGLRDEYYSSSQLAKWFQKVTNWADNVIGTPSQFNNV